LTNEWSRKDPEMYKKTSLEHSRKYHKEHRKEEREYSKEYRETHKAQYQKYNKEYIRKERKLNKNLVFLYYSNGVVQCACCGELEEVFLTIDHIRGRKTYGHGYNEGGYKLYAKLVKSNFPEGYRILCWNCNWAKHRLSQCPHQISKINYNTQSLSKASVSNYKNQGC